MLAAAGIVVTEIRTPIKAPDLAEVSDRTPAVPARYATMKEKTSGLGDELRERMALLREVIGDEAAVPLSASASRKVAVIPSGNPIASATRERLSEVAAQLNRGHAQAGDRTELGPDHHRADDQHDLVGEYPDRGDHHREQP